MNYILGYLIATYCICRTQTIIIIVVNESGGYFGYFIILEGTEVVLSWTDILNFLCQGNRHKRTLVYKTYNAHASKQANKQKYYFLQLFSFYHFINVP